MAGVLRVSKVRSGGAAYYLEVAGRVRAPGSRRRAGGRGRGRRQLRLSGVVEAADLEAVLAGEDPGTGRVLGTARRQVTVAGFDMTFSAPKSVSLLHALGDPEVADAVRRRARRRRGGGRCPTSNATRWPSAGARPGSRCRCRRPSTAWPPPASSTA